MKFISFGDLVEVTYDDGSIELISKEKAVELGYKERNEIKISYKGQILNCSTFNELSGISRNTIYRLYYEGLRTGEDIIDAYNKMRKCKRVLIPYNGSVYTARQLGKLLCTNGSTIVRYYQNGLKTGEEIEAAYNKQKENRTDVQIFYNGTIYNSVEFGRETGMNPSTVRSYYNKGFHKGEEIIEAFNANKPRVTPIKITYKGKEYTRQQFAKISKIKPTTIYSYYKKGLCTGEEIISAYKGYEETINNILIPYKGTNYTVNQLSKKLKIYYMRIYTYYLTGLRTGEEILATYNRNKRKVIEFPYNGNIYTMTQFSELTKISRATVFNYYKKGVRTGEEMIELYNSRKHS